MKQKKPLKHKVFLIMVQELVKHGTSAVVSKELTIYLKPDPQWHYTTMIMKQSDTEQFAWLSREQHGIRAADS